jgi:hypothetical protein
VSEAMLKNPKVVKREDATLHLSDEKEAKIPLDADHSEMCKFKDPDGPDFEIVWRSIRIMARDAVQRAAARSQ